MGSADRWPDLTGKSWAHKTSTQMTDDEVNDARATFEAVGRTDYEGEWLRRHGLPEDYGWRLDTDQPRCPDCNSDDLNSRRYDTQPHLTRLTCGKCGHSWREEA